MQEHTPLPCPTLHLLATGAWRARVGCIDTVHSDRRAQRGDSVGVNVSHPDLNVCDAALAAGVPGEDLDAGHDGTGTQVNTPAAERADALSATVIAAWQPPPPAQYDRCRI